MSDQLGPRASEPPVGADMGAWAAGEVTKHEEICGLRYQRIDERMERIEQGVAAINQRYKDSIKYVLGLLASLGVALVLLFLQQSSTRAQADESDKREMRARLSLLTQQLANVQPKTLVVTPGAQPSVQAAPAQVMPDMSPPLDPLDLNEAAGGKPKPHG